MNARASSFIDARLPARAVAALVLFELGLLRFALDASAQQAFVFGRPLPFVCALRARFGLPCPTCGLTRALGLTLHGHFGAAWALFPAAPLAVVLGAGLALFVLVRGWPAGPDAAAARERRWLTAAALAGSGATFVAWLAGWLWHLARAVHGGA